MILSPFSYLYSFESLGEDEDDPEISSADFMEAEANQEDMPLVYFKPRPLKNLMLVDELESLAPLVDAKVHNLTDDDTPQILVCAAEEPDLHSEFYVTVWRYLKWQSVNSLVIQVLCGPQS
jgi:hypothetical protein